MKKNIFKILMALFFLPQILLAAITFDSDGKWETTFNYPECTQRGGGGAVSCDDVQTDNIAWNWGAAAIEGNYSQVNTDANHPPGTGNGARFWVGDGQNIQSGAISVTLPSAQQEIWIRYYIRYEAGFNWSNQGYEKHLYIRTAPGPAVVTGFGGGGRFYVYSAGNSPSASLYSSLTWNNQMANPANVSNGEWIAFEVYLKMDTNGTDGVTRLWIDGNLVLDREDVNHSGGSSAVREGWTYFDFNNNQDRPDNINGPIGRSYAYVDYDDIAIYNQTPPNTDAHGNRFIGLLNSDEEAAPLPPSPTESPAPVDPVTGLTKENLLFSESFENNTWSARGWYDGTNSTGVASGGYAGSALRWEWGSGATRPTGFSVIRKKIPVTDEFLLEYYVKHETGWRGSSRNYHPHLIHVLSSDDTEYQGLSQSNSGLYFESWASTTFPYRNYPVVAHQDMLRVNISEGSVPNNLVAVTENRSATQCNTPYALSGASSGACYFDGVGYYSANTWLADGAEIPANAWTKITAYIKRNTFTNGVANFDGIMKLWVNDTLALNKTSVLYASGANVGAVWDKLALAPWIGDGSPVTQAMWLDELQLWTINSDTKPEPSPLLQLIQ